MRNLLKLTVASLLVFSASPSSAGRPQAYNQLTGFQLYPGAISAPEVSVPALPVPAAKASCNAVAYTDYHSRRLAAMAGAPLLQINFVDGGMNGQDLCFYWGVPVSVRKVRPAEVGIMRHWTSNAQVNGTPVVDLIVNSGLLKAGSRPYIIPESHQADYYQDLHGVFFTTPDFPPENLLMGLLPNSDFVDFVVNPEMGSLYLARGNYLFPCPAKVQAWIAEAYLKWKKTGVMPSGMERTLAHIDREGGLQDPVDIPVTVVRYQKNGKTTVLRPDLLKKPY